MTAQGPTEPLAIGRVAGHRGNAGELTVRVFEGDASRWVELERVILTPRGRHDVRGGTDDGRSFVVQSARGYRDRLVLKLDAVDGPSEAEALRGSTVSAPPDALPALDEGEYFLGALVGAQVETEDGRRLGQVLDVIATGGVDVLVVGPGPEPQDSDVLIPLAPEIVIDVDYGDRAIRVRPPEGLIELNR